MAGPSRRTLDNLLGRHPIDPEWYCSTYPDVAALGMDAERHFRRYGALLGRAPNADIAAAPLDLEALLQEVPRAGRKLVTAHEIARTGRHDLGLRFAELHVPADLVHMIGPLRANAALARGGEGGWL
ncbi:MAG: hypothetical protein IT542_10440 [Rubellimicrobium sp.]|nr:hypothetical protein [Rubellimicrobium sp.]